MYLGLNISHDSSAALINSSGDIIAAISEERLTRKKHHMTFPQKSIEYLLGNYKGEIEQVIIGSISKFEFASMNNLHWIFNPWDVAKFDGQMDKHMYPPGFSPTPKFDSKNDKNGINRETWVKNEVQLRLSNLGVEAPIKFQDHHDSHVFSAFAGFGAREGLVVSLDGYGDGYSGVIKKFNVDSTNSYVVEELARFSDKQSFGFLYSAITDRYNFKPNSHEGKITGLAALGSHSPALEFLQKKIQVKNGVPDFKIPNSRFTRLLFEILFRITNLEIFSYSIRNIISIAGSKKGNYEDLAFAAQYILEESVQKVVNHFLVQSKMKNLFLAGGIFANVRVNQKLAESSLVESTYIFPNMGDGGIAVGCVWSFMHENGKLSPKIRFNDMYLGNEPGSADQVDQFGSEIYIHRTTSKENIEIVSSALVANRIVGCIMGRMEFGPRALLNRTIFASPASVEINKSLNKRLRRTEFMPFAPAVLVEDSKKIFNLEKFCNLEAFNYMTMTCDVREEWRPIMPAVVHIDGTARPQFISQTSHSYGYNLISRFKAKTGIPCLINTSFNIHEEPIVSSIGDAITALKERSVDYVTDGSNIYCLAGTENETFLKQTQIS